MDRVIKINCKHVYESGLEYEDKAKEIENILKTLVKAGEDIKNIWPSDDGNNFLVSYNKHILDLNDIIEFLDDEAYILKGCALEHSNIDNNFSDKMKRSDEYEQG